jgi:hypothetical protein
LEALVLCYNTAQTKNGKNKQQEKQQQTKKDLINLGFRIFNVRFREKKPHQVIIREEAGR